MKKTKKKAGRPKTATKKKLTTQDIKEHKLIIHQIKKNISSISIDATITATLKNGKNYSRRTTKRLIRLKKW